MFFNFPCDRGKFPPKKEARWRFSNKKRARPLGGGDFAVMFIAQCTANSLPPQGRHLFTTQLGLT